MELSVTDRWKARSARFQIKVQGATRGISTERSSVIESSSYEARSGDVAVEFTTSTLQQLTQPDAADKVQPTNVGTSPTATLPPCTSHLTAPCTSHLTPRAKRAVAASALLDADEYTIELEKQLTALQRDLEQSVAHRSTSVQRVTELTMELAAEKAARAAEVQALKAVNEEELQGLRGELRSVKTAAGEEDKQLIEDLMKAPSTAAHGAAMRAHAALLLQNPDQAQRRRGSGSSNGSGSATSRRNSVVPVSVIQSRALRRGSAPVSIQQWTQQWTQDQLPVSPAEIAQHQQLQQLLATLSAEKAALSRQVDKLTAELTGLKLTRETKLLKTLNNLSLRESQVAQLSARLSAQQSAQTAAETNQNEREIKQQRQSVAEMSTMERELVEAKRELAESRHKFTEFQQEQVKAALEMEAKLGEVVDQEKTELQAQVAHLNSELVAQAAAAQETTTELSSQLGEARNKFHTVNEALKHASLAHAAADAHSVGLEQQLQALQGKPRSKTKH